VVSGTVAVALLVGADREFGDVRHHRVVRELEADVLAARAALLPFLELEAPDIRDEVRFPDASGVESARTVEIFLPPVIAVAEDIWAAE
jgi:hypothetical protein